MQTVNKVILLGHLGKDPETKNLENNVSVTRITLATSETYKAEDGTKNVSTDWHNVVLWRGLSEIAQKYLKKGALIYIEGKLKTRSYDDKEGKKVYVTEIVADEMKMLDKKPS